MRVGRPTTRSSSRARSTSRCAGEAPRLLKAEVNVPQVQELLGTDAPTTIRLYPGLCRSGASTPATGVFAEVVKETPARRRSVRGGVARRRWASTFSSDQAGGFATPNLGVSTLSRELGPLAGKVADA